MIAPGRGMWRRRWRGLDEIERLESRRLRDSTAIANRRGRRYTRRRGGCPMPPISAPASLIAALLLLVEPPAAGAQAPLSQIVIAQPAEATTMDPGRSTQVLTVNYFFNLYDTLTRWDVSLKLEPGLATAWKNVNETTWEFALRPGVKFHDGALLTAEDVKATVERNLIPGRTVVQPGFSTIDAVEIVNPSTVSVVTEKPDPLLPVRMPQMGSEILPERL